MASTNFTTHYEIPLPLGTDLTTPMDYNTSMEAVDTALFGAVTDADQAAELAGQANDTANTAASAVEDVSADLTLEKAKIVALQTRMTNAENEIDDVRSDVQDSICAYNEPTATSTHHYNVGDFFFYNDTLYVATAEININDTITPNTNCDTTTITAELLAGGGVDKVGDLDDLVTEDKSSCVAAINEVALGKTLTFTETADGVKTRGQCLDELFGKLSAAITKYGLSGLINSQLAVSDTGVYKCVGCDSNTLSFEYAYLYSTGSFIAKAVLKTSGSQTESYTLATNTYSNSSSNVVTNGVTFTLSILV